MEKIRNALGTHVNVPKPFLPLEHPMRQLSGVVILVWYLTSQDLSSRQVIQ